MKNSHLLGVVFAFTIAVLTTTAHAALVVPASLNPGDNYHVIFVSSTVRNPTSVDMRTYDAFVQTAADAAGIGASIGIEWRALGSTVIVDARDHLQPLFTDPTAPIFNQNGDLVAQNFNQLFSGSLSHAVAYDEYGAGNFGALPWTGTNADGTAATSLTLGSGSVLAGHANFSNSDWVNTIVLPSNHIQPMYAVSEQLTAPIPLPPVVWLFSSGLLGLVGIARSKKAA